MSQILARDAQTTPPCSAPGCDKARFNVSSGLCSMHYYRVRRHGTLDGHTPRADLATRLLRHVQIGEPPAPVWARLLSCWEWTGRRCGRDDQYGRTTIDGRTTTAHRAIVIAVCRSRGGELDDALEVHHRCHNPGCVNPAHLEAITWLDHCAEHGWRATTDGAGRSSRRPDYATDRDARPHRRDDDAYWADVARAHEETF